MQEFNNRLFIKSERGWQRDQSIVKSTGTIKSLPWVDRACFTEPSVPFKTKNIAFEFLSQCVRYSHSLVLVFDKKSSRSGGRAEQAEVLSPEPGDLSAIPGTHMLERENRLWCIVLWPPNRWHGTCTHAQKINVNFFKGLQVSFFFFYNFF